MEFFHAFVLHTLDYKDTSKILYLYSEKGQSSVIARGVKKMNSINRFLAQNGTLIKLTTTKSDFPTLKEGELVEEFEHIKKDIISYSYMNHILELVRNVVDEHNDHDKMFRFLYKIFKEMDNGVDPETLTFIFELKLLYLIGYGLNFETCHVCDEPQNLVFHPSSGGLTCERHLGYNEHSYDKDVYNKIEDLYFLDISKDDIPEIKDIYKTILRHIIDLLYDEFVSFKSKSLEIIKQIKKY